MKKIIIILAGIAFVQCGFAQHFTLDSCKYLAIENNKTLNEARLEIQASQEVKKEAFTKYFPNVSGMAMAMKSSDPFLELETPEMNLPVYDGNPANLLSPTQFAYVPPMSIEALDYLNAAAITALQPLFTGGRIYNGNKLAKLGVAVNEEKLKLTTQEVLVNTENLYWSIISLKEKRKTLQSFENLLNKLMEDVNVAYEAGLVHRSDVLKVQLKLNEVAAKKLKLNNGIDMLKMALAQTIGVEYNDEFDIAMLDLAVNEPHTVYVTPGSALVNRSEHKMLNMAVEAEELQKKIALGEHLPQVAVGVQALYLDMMEQQHNHNFGLAFATVSVPISDWWIGSYKHKEHKIKCQIAQNTLDEKSELLQLQMEKLYKQLLESYKQIEVANTSVKQSEEHLQVMQHNYDAGTVSTSDLLEAQAVSQEAHDQLVDSKTNYQISLAAYKKATAQYGM